MTAADIITATENLHGFPFRACSRCDGSGHYSSCAQHGTECFQCMTGRGEGSGLYARRHSRRRHPLRQAVGQRMRPPVRSVRSRRARSVRRGRVGCDARHRAEGPPCRPRRWRHDVPVRLPPARDTCGAHHLVHSPSRARLRLLRHFDHDKGAP